MSEDIEVRLGELKGVAIPDPDVAHFKRLAGKSRAWKHRFFWAMAVSAVVVVGVSWPAAGPSVILGSPPTTSSRQLQTLASDADLDGCALDCQSCAGDEGFAARHLSVAWCVETGDSRTEPVVDEMHVYLTTEDEVVARSRTTGEVAWATNVGNALTSQPVVHNGLLYVADLSSRALTALDSLSGAIVWRVGGPDDLDQVGSSPREHAGQHLVAFQDSVYTTTPSREVVAYEADTGQERWRVANVGNPWAPVVATQYATVVQTAFGVVGLSPSSGDEIWRWEGVVNPYLEDRGDGFLAVTVEGELILAGSASGDVIWSSLLYTADDAATVGLSAIEAGDVGFAIALDNGLVQLVDPLSGEVIWSYTAPSRPVGLAIHERYIYVTTAEGLSVLAVADGQLEFSIGSEQESVSRAIVSGQTVFWGADGTTLSAFEAD